MKISLSWKKGKNDKVVIKHNGVYSAFTLEELEQLLLIIEDVQTDQKKYFKEDNRN